MTLNEALTAMGTRRTFHPENGKLVMSITRPGGPIVRPSYGHEELSGGRYALQDGTPFNASAQDLASPDWELGPLPAKKRAAEGEDVAQGTAVAQPPVDATSSGRTVAKP